MPAARLQSALVLVVVLALILIVVLVLILVLAVLVVVLILRILHERQPPFPKRYGPIVSGYPGHYTAPGENKRKVSENNRDIPGFGPRRAGP